ncbi:MAG: helix-turn-helix domain-containing protein [Reyranellaceae bacterium]
MSSALVRQINRRMTILHLDRASLSRKAGLNETWVRDVVEGRVRSPRADSLRKIAKALGCTVADLMEDKPSIAAQRSTGGVVAIPELDVHVASGLGVGEEGTVMEAHEAAAMVGQHTYPLESFREAFAISPARVRIIPVKGNSMEPELWSGQRVMVDIEDKVPSPPGIFVVWDGLGLVLKYVEVIPNSEPLRVRIASAHPAFKPYERNLDEAHINGRVIGVWKRT